MLDSEISENILIAEKFIASNLIDKAKSVLLSILDFNKYEPRANHLIGLIYIDCNNFDIGLTHLLIALNSSPNSYLLNYQIGSTYLLLNEFSKAESFFENCLLLNPNSFDAIHDLAVAQASLGKSDLAIKNFELASLFGIESAELFFNIGKLHHDQRNFQSSLHYYNLSLDVDPDFLKSLINKGIILQEQKLYSSAIESFLKAFDLCHDDYYLAGMILHLKMLMCDWTDYTFFSNIISEGLNSNKRVAEPFGFQAISFSESDLQLCAQIYSNDIFPPNYSFKFSKSFASEKIRIGYLSGEFRDHATSHLICELIENHSSDKFEIFAFDNGYSDGSIYRERLEAAFTNIFDISKVNDFSAASLIFNHDIDILINLNGFFGLGRNGIFSLKPVPIQINFLGFPGTMGSSYMDYIVADKYVLPSGSEKFYSEKIMYLPGCYQCNDSNKFISGKSYSRSDFGLPENCFIFCCFNNNYKITPERFALWMEILKSVPNSVLWLLNDNQECKINLVSHCISHGVSSNRLFFADRISLSEHLARHRLADLFLDTLPYNAHTTASDALWAGIPVLTQIGPTFPGRVAASLLLNSGLSELVVNSDREYVDKAIELALNPDKICSIRNFIKTNRNCFSIFDTKSYVKSFEFGLETIFKNYLENKSFDNIFL